MYSQSASFTEGGGGQGIQRALLARGNTYRILVENLQGWIPLERCENENEICVNGTGLEGVDNTGADGGRC